MLVRQRLLSTAQVAVNVAVKMGNGVNQTGVGKVHRLWLSTIFLPVLEMAVPVEASCESDQLSGGEADALLRSQGLPPTEC